MLPLRYGAAWLLMGWLLVFGSIAISLFPGGAHVPQLVDERVAHFIVYFVLMSWFAGLYPSRRYGLIAGGLLILGVALEVLQGALVPRRAAQLGDIAANVSGIVAAILVALVGLGGWCQRVEKWLQTSPEA